MRILIALFCSAVQAANVEFCPTMHADFMRQQQSIWNSSTPFTEADGKKHTPYITINGTTATVTVGGVDGAPFHPMAAFTAGGDVSAVHFVTHIYVLNQDGGFVTMEALDPSSVSKASISFDVPSGATSLQAYEFCNKHGLWQGPKVNLTAGSQALTCGKDAVESTAWDSVIADFHRLQASVWNSAEPFTETQGKKHTPYTDASLQSGTEASFAITITVGDGSPFHPMTASTDPADVHWITHIYVLNHEQKVMFFQALDPNNVSKASASFTHSFKEGDSPQNLTAYEFCNKHGLWRGPTLTLMNPLTKSASGPNPTPDPAPAPAPAPAPSVTTTAAAEATAGSDTSKAMVPLTAPFAVVAAFLAHYSLL